jgi:hypothetical protein
VAGVTGQALLEGASSGTALSLPYCRYLVSALMEAVAGAADESLDQPQLNYRTVFAETWHAASLALLSDADISNLWRVADYLMLDTVCITCLEDILVQRPSRTNLDISCALLGQLSPSAATRISMRVRRIREQAATHPYAAHRAAVRGIDVPVDSYEMMMAAAWGHEGLIQMAHAQGVAWGEHITAHAARGGHLRVLQLLRQYGCPWSERTVYVSMREHPKIAVWALDNGAPVTPNCTAAAFHYGCLPVIQWLRDHGHLPDFHIGSPL